MLLQAFLFVVGLLLLYFGAEWLIKGAASIALQYGIRPLIVGLTVVALGTSMPEFVVNFFAALTGEESLALGNIVGSNICNIALILGTTALILPLAVSPATLKKEYPIMMAVLFLFYALALDGVIGRADGLLLVAGALAQGVP
ncbi:MAG: sodium:calcium antiporter, partial [Rhodothermales bacterium]